MDQHVWNWCQCVVYCGKACNSPQITDVATVLRYRHTLWSFHSTRSMLYFTNSETKNNDEKVSSRPSTISLRNPNAAQVLWKKKKRRKRRRNRSGLITGVFFFCTMCFSRDMTEFRQKHREKKSKRSSSKEHSYKNMLGSSPHHWTTC